MTIHKEHYRDFLSTLDVKIEEINKEIKVWEDLFDKGAVDFGEDWEYYDLCKEFRYLKRIKEHFAKDRWADFASLDSLKAYVSIINRTHDALTKYSNTILPVDNGALVGATQSEWNAFEKLRYKISQKYQAWECFLYFCENGTIQ